MHIALDLVPINCKRQTVTILFVIFTLLFLNWDYDLEFLFSRLHKKDLHASIEMPTV